MGPIEIYTDGACLGNPGPGGWAVVILWPHGSKDQITGGASCTTNNAMELSAAIDGLKNTSGPVKIYSDSEYVVKGITQWIHGWLRRGWKTADKSPVKNADLWRELHALTQGRDVSWEWVRGHDGNRWNERCDYLATTEARRQQLHRPEQQPFDDTPRLVRRAL